MNISLITSAFQQDQIANHKIIVKDKGRYALVDKSYFQLKKLNLATILQSLYHLVRQENVQEKDLIHAQKISSYFVQKYETTDKSIFIRIKNALNKVFNWVTCNGFKTNLEIAQSLNQFLISKTVQKPKVLSEAQKIYNQMADIRNPTTEDYRNLQNYLTNGNRPEIEVLKDYKDKLRYFKIIGDKPGETPTTGIEHVNCDESYKECCLITYASFNNCYPKGVKRLVDQTKASDFKGHILWRIGGWPNVEDGSLNLAHVPYAFKACLFKEAYRLGYKKVLFLDASILPTVSLNDLFKRIQEKGHFIVGNHHNVGPYMNERAAHAFNLTLEETHRISSISASSFGLDLSTEKGKKLMDAFYAAAQHETAHYSARNEQNAMSLILHKHGIKESEYIPIRQLAHNDKEVPGSLLLIDRGYSYAGISLFTVFKN